MDKDEFISQIKNISKRVEQLRDTLETEEATKTSLIMPFFQALGYDVFNPLEFVPEYTADVGIKRRKSRLCNSYKWWTTNINWSQSYQWKTN